MKRPYLHKQNKKDLKPFFVYAARNLFEIKNILKNKTVNYTILQGGILLVWFKD